MWVTEKPNHGLCGQECFRERRLEASWDIVYDVCLLKISMFNLVSFPKGRSLTGWFAGVKLKVVVVKSVLKITMNTFLYNGTWCS